MFEVIQRIKITLRFFKDLIFPIFCLSCQKEGAWVCDDCLEALKKEIKPQFFCPYCYKDNEDGRTCQGCRPFSFLDGIMSVASYENEIISKLIQMLKYDYIEDATEVFGKLIEDFVDRLIGSSQNCHSRFRGDDNVEFAILPVPLHRRRYLERGFNQAALLARKWSGALGAPMATDVLIRQRPTQTQVGLGREDRQHNLVGAFCLKKSLAGQSVLLIDDVFTTGSTLQECARVLKEGGVKEVWGMTVAREK